MRSRRLWRAVMLSILVLEAFVSGPALADRKSDENAIRSVYKKFETSWNTPGMPGFEDLFTEDADFVVITGKWLKGRDEIVDYHRKLLQSVYAGSGLFTDAIDVRFVSDDLAIGHFRSGAKFQQDGKLVARTSLSTATFVKAGGAWRITAFHNTLTGGPGYAFGPPPGSRDGVDKPK
jgi:uncharacterized protein (TIGR02246 family)